MDDTTHKPTPESTGGIPPFLSREEYERVGDDPEPLPKGFEVIDGTGGEAAPTPDAPTDADASAEAEEAGIRAIGSFFTEGASAVRAVGAAKKAHDTARAELKALDGDIAARQAELEHRRDVERNFDAIIADRTAAMKTATEAVRQSVARQGELGGRVEELKAELQKMKEADDQTEKRLKAAVEAAEAKEGSARETGSRLQRRLDDARRNLEKAEKEQVSGIEAAERAIEGARARLATLNDEYAELQRNPSANTAEYSVRTGELKSEIAEATVQLRHAEENLPLVREEVAHSLATARAMAVEAEKPIAEAKKQFEAVTAEADEARDELDTAKGEARERQRELRERISEQEKELKAERQAAERAQEEADAAKDAIDEANGIHAHPERTEELAARLADDVRVREDKARQVDALAATEQDVRERTRGSRLRFIAAVVGTIVVVAAAIVLWFALS